jgi:predicted transposase/invertase (TIGR01784 family)
MAYYLDPKNDLTFKYIFGEHEHLCMSLLNSILPLEKDRQIVSLQYLPSELVPETPIIKDTLVDVRCIDNTGRQFIVEMQMYWTTSFEQRVLFNASKAYVRQLDSGKNYKLLQPVYALSFVNDIFDEDRSVYYHDYKIVNIANTEKRIEGLELVFIELPKFRPVNQADKKLFDLWLKFLTEIKESSTNVPPELLDEEITRDALHCLELNSYTRAQLDAYDRYWDIIRTHSTYLEDKIEEGIAKGIEEGITKGREEGREEALTEMVLNGMRNGFSVEQMQTLIGLSREKIEEIIRLNNMS